MAFDKNNMPVGMKVVVVVFAVILVLSLMLPFFSTCSMAGSSSGQGDEAADEVEETQRATTVADIDAAYQPQIASLTAKLADDPGNLAALANLGNTCMDWGTDLQQADDAGTDEASAHIEDVFMTAVSYYDQYLEQDPDSRAVRVDRACCEYYAGDVDGGLADLESYVAEDDAFSPAWFNLGLFRYQEGQLEDALDAFNRAVEADGAESFGVGVMAQIYASMIQSQLDAEAEAAEEEAAEEEAAEGEGAEGEDAGEDADAPAAEEDAADADADAPAAEEADADAAVTDDAEAPAEDAEA